MTKFIAFLRAIHVGGHTVKMEDLRRIFAGMGFAGVETFIASGNVIFSAAEEAARLEPKIENELRQALGYEVKTFLRTDAQVGAIAHYQPFPAADMAAAAALNVGFMKQPLDVKSEHILQGLKTDIDDFHTQGAELYWLCQKKQSESTFSNAVFEKKLRIQTTFRGWNTIQRLAARYTP